MRKRFSIFGAILLGLATSIPTFADERASINPRPYDSVNEALKDELSRSKDRLKLNGHNGPYFLSYTVTQYDSVTLAASCGAITENEHKRWRDLKTDVREGDYKLDSSNFSAPANSAQGILPHGNVVTIEPDYDAIRHTVWLRTDADYKLAIKNLEAKKTYLAQNNVRERPDDMSKETPVVVADQPLNFDFDTSHWLPIVKSLSSIFTKYPAIQHSQIGFSANGCRDWFVNSEGTNCREYQNQYILTIMASLQADDGMQLADSRVFAAINENELPTMAQMEAATKDMIEKLIAVKSAPLADEYRGPVLLEGQASAEFFNQILRPNLGHAQENLVGGLDNPQLLRRNPLKDLYHRKILPDFISVTDDPLTKKYKDQPIFGGYKLDDDGVPAQKVLLIDKGILKTFCTSRIPTLYTDHSNGHSVNGIGEANILYVDSTNQLTPAQLKDKLIELGKQEGLDKVMIVRRLSTYDAALYDPLSMLAEVKANAASGGGGGVSARPPLLLYSVSTKDGHEELVRGAQFSSLSLRVLRDIVCTGDDAKPYLSMGGLYAGSTGLSYAHLIAPSILISEVELRKPERETEKLPYLANPYSEK